MKRFTYSFLSLGLALTAFASLAEEAKAEPTVQPFNLVHLAYQGRLVNEGVPGYESLISSIQTGKVTAESLIEAAIEDGRLSTESLDNESYVTSVERSLERLYDHGR